MLVDHIHDICFSYLRAAEGMALSDMGAEFAGDSGVDMKAGQAYLAALSNKEHQQLQSTYYPYCQALPRQPHSVWYVKTSGKHI